MAKLLRLPNSEVLISNLRIADSMGSRMRGLLGTTELASDEALWIQRCNSIHTFFMNYAIDCVFLDKKLMVKSVKQNVTPGHIVWPQWGAVSVVEMKAGVAVEKWALQKGDQLHVST